MGHSPSAASSFSARACASAAAASASRGPSSAPMALSATRPPPCRPSTDFHAGLQNSADNNKSGGPQPPRPSPTPTTEHSLPRKKSMSMIRAADGHLASPRQTKAKASSSTKVKRCSPAHPKNRSAKSIATPSSSTTDTSSECSAASNAMGNASPPPPKTQTGGGDPEVALHLESARATTTAMDWWLPAHNRSRIKFGSPSARRSPGRNSTRVWSRPVAPPFVCDM
mmetsp:Transcript_52253/g.140634  ORF Transcript_52253/g.140634 Transcript_52253/m.140634 type:complete len:226 (+) Transcript_52253:317-994(+)